MELSTYLESGHGISPVVSVAQALGPARRYRTRKVGAGSTSQAQPTRIVAATDHRDA